MRLLIDMNLTPRWEPYLVANGHQAIHWSKVGDASAGDSEICEHARQNKLVLLTNDLDFPQILAHTREAQPSVILLRGEPLVPEARGISLLNAIRESESELINGAVLTIDWYDRPRARLLPLS